MDHQWALQLGFFQVAVLVCSTQGGCHVPAWVYTSPRASVRVLSSPQPAQPATFFVCTRRADIYPPPSHFPAGAERVFLIDILSTNTASPLQRGGDTWTAEPEPLTRCTASNSSRTTEMTIAASFISGTKLAALHLAHTMDNPTGPSCHFIQFLLYQR